MAQILWRLVNQATIATLRGESGGQYHIALTRDAELEAFFAGLPRTGVSELGGYTISVPIEAALGPPTVGPQLLRVRYMGPESKRRDWNIPSQRPTTAYPLWRPGVGLQDDTRPDTDYVILVRDDANRFHARWVAEPAVQALPQTLQRRITGEAVGVSTLSAEEWAVIGQQLGLQAEGGADLALSHRRDELILVLDAFVEHEGNLTDAQVEELADQVGRVQATAEGGVDVALRVTDHLTALRTVAEDDLADIDPEITEVLRDFGDDPQHLYDVADAIRANLETPDAVELVPDVGITEAPEGRILTAVHVRRERSHDLRQSKIAAVGGQPLCEVCGFDFFEAYGERGRGFIECHHLVPVHELTPEAVSTLDDLALVCANCHRMIHARRPWLGLDELRVMVQRG